MFGRGTRGLSPVTSRLDELFADLPVRLDVQDVADLLGMTKKGVYRWINEGTIPAYKIGASWVILRDELKDTFAQGSNMTHRFRGAIAPEAPVDDSQDAPE